MLPTTSLAGELITIERRCFLDWMHALQNLPTNPYGVAIQDFGGATAILSPEAPLEVFNRVFQFSFDDLAYLPDILSFYQIRNAPLLFDLSPYTNYATDSSYPLPLILAQNGLCQAGFHQMLYGLPTINVPSPPPHIAIKVVTPDDANEFVAIFQEEKGNDAIRVLLDHPHYQCFLAYVDAEPAALGVLHIADGAASMANGITRPAFRRRGCQTALLNHRIRAAAEAGCNIMVSQCVPGSVSQNNQLRVGFNIAGTKVWWVPQSP